MSDDKFKIGDMVRILDVEYVRGFPPGTKNEIALLISQGRTILGMVTGTWASMYGSSVSFSISAAGARHKQPEVKIFFKGTAKKNSFWHNQLRRVA
jgi:hypothetical protein